MGVFDRLTNVAKGKIIVWRRGTSDEPAPLSEVEDLERRPVVPETSDVTQPLPTSDTPRTVPVTPRKRRL